jgi:transcriptional regulator with XRE-family HTH domain
MDNKSADLFLLEKKSLNRLRDVRLLKRITQIQLKLLTGINQTKISWIENGLVKAREDEKKKLAQALTVKVEEIWGTEDENTKSIQK